MINNGVPAANWKIARRQAGAAGTVLSHRAAGAMGSASHRPAPAEFVRILLPPGPAAIMGICTEPVARSCRRRGRIEPLRASTPQELKSCPSTSLTHPGFKWRYLAASL